MRCAVSWRAILMSVGLCLALAASPGDAEAFCGFYVAGANTKLFNNATEVVLMREGTRTALSMQNNYQGPPRDFAMVVPVPVVLQKENVKVLKPDVFEKIDRLAAPRLVEYWEQDPCPKPRSGDVVYGLAGSGVGAAGYGRGGGGGIGARRPTVQIKAQFDVGEYEIVILSAQDSLGLEQWLKEKRYNIPDGASASLRPYIDQGMYFFVARVNARKVTFSKGQATLSPLRFHYDSPSFSLPVRLGLLNAHGKQDLIVHILSREGRYEVQNLDNATIPTNLIVKPTTRARFGSFYAALLDDTLERNPGAVVTEYAWSASSCDPCPGPTLDTSDLFALGGDVIDGGPPITMTERPSFANTQLTIAPPKVKARGAYSSNQIKATLRRHKRRFQHCHERIGRARPQDTTDEGFLTAELDIAPTGRVTRVRMRQSTMGDPVTRCIHQAMRRIRFPSLDPNAQQRPTQVIAAMRVNARTTTIMTPDRNPSWSANQWTLTRLHARYDAASLRDDLIFKAAAPLYGGRGVPRGLKGELETGAQPGRGVNTFQGRYVILNPWRGAMTCAQPRRGSWGGPPSGSRQVNTARNTAFANRRGVNLNAFLTSPLSP